MMKAVEDTAVSVDSIVVADADATTKGSLQVSISCLHGELTLTDISSNIKFESGTGTADASMVFVGSVAGINDALKSLQYRSNAHWNSVSSGHDTITVTVNDRGNTGSGGQQTTTKVMSVFVSAVNDAPVVVVPGALSVNEDTKLSVGGVSVSDADVDETYGAVLEVSLSVQHGTLAVGAVPGLLVTAGAASSGIAARG